LAQTDSAERNTQDSRISNQHSMVLLREPGKANGNQSQSHISQQNFIMAAIYSNSIPWN
jgi:hypothetical protein